MRARDVLFGLCLGVATAGVAETAATNWLNEAVTVRLPQSEIVRHPLDNGKYYLCWTDGVSHYGLAFRRTELESNLRSVPRGGRVAVTSLMGQSTLPAWTPGDSRICWPS